MLDVRQNKFTSESGKFIALAIAQNNSLTSLLTTGLGNEELAHIAVRMDMNVRNNNNTHEDRIACGIFF